MKVIFHVTQQKKGKNNSFIVPLLDIEPIVIKKPLVKDFVKSFKKLQKELREKISENELKSYMSFNPVFRINMEYEYVKNKDDIINKQYETDLLEFYKADKDAIVYGAKKIFSIVAKDFIDIYKTKQREVNRK